ncbi:unnamed protein product [Cylicocyclus nassatus]|uniref:Uncharacterized protein n=1 Tax=Cylicocyclus nassatus TaxID=53992 RepID=A0AA36DPW8_CYLNA|nr:unnamed protein product [Cylicocyclus nassatus]
MFYLVVLLSFCFANAYVIYVIYQSMQKCGKNKEIKDDVREELQEESKLKKVE